MLSVKHKQLPLLRLVLDFSVFRDIGAHAQSSTVILLCDVNFRYWRFHQIPYHELGLQLLANKTHLGDVVRAINYSWVLKQNVICVAKHGSY